MPRPRIPLGQHGEIWLTEPSDKTNGKWIAKCEYRGDDGRMHRMSRANKSREKARYKLETAFEEKVKQGGGSVTADMKLSRLLELYLEEKARTVKEGSMAAYKSSAKHIANRIGDLYVSEAKPLVLQRFIDYVTENVGAGSAKTCKTILSGMFKIAVQNGALIHNPVAELDAVEQDKEDAADPIPLDKLGHVFDIISSTRAFVTNDEVDLLKLMAWTGLRVAEACGLCWDCVDLDAATIAVERQALRSKGRGIVLEDSTKTDAGHRKIHVAPFVVDMLRERQRFTADDNPLNLVFPNPRGGAHDKGTVQRHVRESRDRFDCGDLRISTHSFRKTCASVLDASGASSLEVADYLGHEKPDVTEKVYIRRFQHTQESAQRLESCGVLAGL